MGQRRVRFVFMLLLFHVLLVARFPRTLQASSASAEQDKDDKVSARSIQANGEEITVARRGGSSGGHAGSHGGGPGRLHGGHGGERGGGHAGWYGATGGGNTQNRRNGNKNYHHHKNSGTLGSISIGIGPLLSAILTSFIFLPPY